MSNEKLEKAVVEFEALMQEIIERKGKIAERLFAGEHENKYSERIANSKPEGNIYSLDAIDEAASIADVNAEWKRKRHAMLVALSRHPGEDMQLAAQAIALLEAVAGAAEDEETELARDVIKAQADAAAANRKLEAAKMAQQSFRLGYNARLLQSFRQAVRAGSELGADRYTWEGLSAPNTLAISGLANTRGTIADMCKTLGGELEHANKSAANLRAVPERVEFVETPTFREAAASPSELAYIGKNYGNNSGLRGLFSAMKGKKEA